MITLTKNEKEYLSYILQERAWEIREELANWHHVNETLALDNVMKYKTLHKVMEYLKQEQPEGYIPEEDDE